MPDKLPLIQSIKLQNFLSFGPTPMELELKSLNVLIGPNGSGKSNLIEAIGFLSSAAKDLIAPIRDGGVSEWLWKGDIKTPIAEIEATINYPSAAMPIRHHIAFTKEGQRFKLEDESIENVRPEGPKHKDVRFFYRFQKGRPVINICESGDFKERKLQWGDLDFDQSVLSQRKDPDRYPEITYLGNQYTKIRLYREWNFGRNTPPRVPQKADLPDDFLEENASNLGLILNDLEHQPGWKEMLDKLKLFSGTFDDISIKVHGGTVQVFLHEKSINQPIPATRLSDGTLRFLCLLAILCHPNPPPLICIEEPELGLHPDIMTTLAEIIKQASTRTQLIITTHSDVLVDAFSEEPEFILVCEKEHNSTTMKRLDRQALSEWLKKYALGELWRMGEIGGKRW